MTTANALNLVSDHVQNQFSKKLVAARYWLLGRKYHTALNALEYTLLKHTGTRKDGYTPEFDHQLGVFNYIRTLHDGLINPEACLAVAFLHDTPEDKGISFEELDQLFGEEISKKVRLLTKVFRNVKLDYKVYFDAMSYDPDASVVKGADRIHNFGSMLNVFSIEKQEEYVAEAEQWIIPMLKEARRRFPTQEPAYENIKHVLKTQMTFARHMHEQLDSLHRQYELSNG